MKNTIYRIVFAVAFVLMCAIEMFADDPATFEGARIWVFGTDGASISVPSEFSTFTRENLTSAADTKGKTASFDGTTTTLFSTENQDLDAATYFSTNFYNGRRVLTINPGANADGTLYVKYQGSKKGVTGANNPRTLKITYTDGTGSGQNITKDITGDEGENSFSITSTGNINIHCDDGWYRVYYIAWQPTVAKEDLVMRLSPGNSNLFVGDDTSIIPYFYDSEAENANQITSISSGVIFSTTTPGIVYVGETSGYVQALSAGTAVINATFPGNAQYNGASATVTLNVNKVAVTGTASLGKNPLKPGESTALTITWTNNGEVVTENSIVSTGNASVATVANGGAVAAGATGTVTGVATGNTVLKIGLNSNRYCAYSHIWDFDAIAANYTDKAVVPYDASSSMTVGGQGCDYCTGELSGFALQGAGGFLLRNTNTIKGLMNNNGGGRYVVIKDLDAGDIVTVVSTGVAPSLYSNGVEVSSNNGVQVFRVSADGDFVINVPRNLGNNTLIHSITVEAATPVHVPVSVTAEMVKPAIKAGDGAALSTKAGNGLGLKVGTPVDIAGQFGAFNGEANVTSSGTLSYDLNNTSAISLTGTSLSASAAGNGDLTINWVPTYTNTSALSLASGDPGLRTIGVSYDASTQTITTDGSGTYYAIWNFGNGLDVSAYTHAVVEVEPTNVNLRLAIEYKDAGVTFLDFPAGTRYLYVPVAPGLLAGQLYIALLGEGAVKVVSAKFADGQYLPDDETINIVAERQDLKNLNMTLTAAKTTIEIDEPLSTTVGYSFNGNPVTGLATTYSSSKPSVATVDASGVVTGVSTGTTTITASFAGNDEYNATTATIEVTVEKIHINIVITPSNPSKMQAETQQLTAVITSVRTGNAISDNLTITWTASEFDPSATGYNSSYKALVDITDNGLVTAMNPGHGPGITSGKALITATFDGSSHAKYFTKAATTEFTVTDNTCFDYMGWDLQGGHTGTLYNASNTSQHYLHWRFGAPEDDNGVQVFRYNGNNNKKYEFTSEILALKPTVHTAESKMSPFCKTRLTDTQRTSEDGVQLDAKGDAFLEYNGMIAGYGTERGGRYMTPISGTFVRVEAEYDGVVTVLIRHNGSVDSSNMKEDGKSGDKTKYKNITQARRALYVVDENGVVMPRTTVNLSNLDGAAYDSDAFKGYLKDINGTYARIAPGSKVQSTYNTVNDAYTYWFANHADNPDGILKTGSGNNVDFSRNAFHFCRNVIYSDYGDTRADDYNTDIREGYHQQKLFYSDEESDVMYEISGLTSKTYFFSKYGYEVLGATHLSISFPVEAGKTYFVGANKSKIGMCTVSFIPSASYSTTDVDGTSDGVTDLWDDAVANPTGSQHSNAWLLSTADGAHLNVKLHRTFTPYRWHPLVLPFSVSESQLRSIFGDDVSVISLDGDLKMLSSMNNYATRDIPAGVTGYYDNTTHVMDGTNDQGTFNGRVIKPSAVRDESVTFTHHYYQMIYANCPVFLWTKESVTDPVFTNVTFQKYTMQKEEVLESDGYTVKANANRIPAINNDYTVKFPYSVDRQIGMGTGTEYDYVMKASYVSSKPTGEIYYVNNIGSGNTTTAYLYHAEAGYAPTMKGTRVWIEPGGANPKLNKPIRSIKMQHFWGEDIDDENLSSGICDIVADQPSEVQMADDNVYDIMGRVVAHGTLDGLASGIYIFKGQKHFVRN